MLLKANVCRAMILMRGGVEGAGKRSCDYLCKWTRHVHTMTNSNPLNGSPDNGSTRLLVQIMVLRAKELRTSIIFHDQ